MRECRPAPWQRFPEHPLGSLFWKMGGGEDWLDEWFEWFQTLSPLERREYLQLTHCPEAWQEAVEEMVQDEEEMKALFGPKCQN